MLKNLFKIAYRNLWKNRIYSFINILGLTIGLASFFVIGTWVYSEYSYDRHFENGDRIYRVGVNFFNIGDMAVSPEILEEGLREFSNVANTTQIDRVSGGFIEVDNQVFEGLRIMQGDADFFDIFDFPFIDGNPGTALNEPFEIVITSELAQQLYNTDKAVGKTLLTGDPENKQVFTVSGVINQKDIKSHINFDALLSTPAHSDINENWTSASVFTYVLMEKGTDFEDLKNNLESIRKKRVYPSVNPGVPYQEWVKRGSAYSFIPVPLHDLYLNSNFRFDFFVPGNLNNVIIFSIVALVILFLAAINFINISTAKSAGRAKEVGIRKTLGSEKKALITQFLMESALMSSLAFIFSLATGELLLNLFRQLTGIELLGSILSSPTQVGVLALISLAVGLAAGLYPAFYLSSFKPVDVLKNVHSGSRKSLFRNILVVTQFSISTALILSTIVVFQQLNYLENKDLGFNADNVLIINNFGTIENSQLTFKENIEQLSGVQSVSINHRVPGSSSLAITNLKTDELENAISIQSFHGDYDFLQTLGFNLVQGRSFNPQLSSDTSSVILNQSAVNAFGISEDPLGRILNNQYEVIGVVSDFHFAGLASPIEPAAIFLQRTGNHLAINYSSNNAQSILAAVQNSWEEFMPNSEMSYYFLDANMQSSLSNQIRLRNTISLFTFLALFVSAIGLFGLSSYVCEQRTKEIGMRKILGAAVGSILVLLNKDFSRLVLLSFLIAFPVGYWGMNSWLSNFAFKIELGIMHFVLAGLLSLLVSWLTVTYISLKTALMNPVDSLKTD